MTEFIVHGSGHFNFYVEAHDENHARELFRAALDESDIELDVYELETEEA